MGKDFKSPIAKIKIKNFLSFNKDGIDLQLLNLNILIGTNGSGKSNLLDALRFWKTLSDNGKTSAQFFSEQGGIRDWFYREGDHYIEQADFEVVTSIVSDRRSRIPIKHGLIFGIKECDQRKMFDLKKEQIECIRGESKEQPPYIYYSFDGGRQAMINTIKIDENRGEEKNYTERRLSKEFIETDKSILLQKVDQELYPILYDLSQLYKGIRIYNSWSFGRTANVKKPQNLFQVAEILDEDYSNFIAVVQKIKNIYSLREKIENRMREVLPSFKIFDIEMIDSDGRLYFIEEGGRKILANRISDGSFRFFVLLILLYNPSKQSEMICIEEPEMGLHPDAIPILADVLKEASQTKQIIVTTHSEILISCFSESPENVVVCENKMGYTTMHRLDGKKLKDWLDDYSLGELWSKGELGGNIYG